LVWPAAQREQLWAQVDPNGSLVGLNPHFVGTARMWVAVVSAEPDEQFPLDGSLRCWASPRGDDPESGLYPFLVDVPDFHVTAAGLALPWFGRLQVAAFARSLECWPDDQAYEASEEAKWGGAGTPERPIRGFAAESFVPSGLFPATGDDAGFRETATAIFTGHVVDAEAAVNLETGGAYRHAVVRTLGGEMDVVADPSVIAGEPAAGGVVQGSFWLSGRPIVEG
jgi:hypothetical protein